MEDITAQITGDLMVPALPKGAFFFDFAFMAHRLTLRFKLGDRVSNQTARVDIA